MSLHGAPLIDVIFGLEMSHTQIERAHRGDSNKEVSAKSFYLAGDGYRTNSSKINTREEQYQYTG